MASRGLAPDQRISAKETGPASTGKLGPPERLGESAANLRHTGLVSSPNDQGGRWVPLSYPTRAALSRHGRGLPGPGARAAPEMPWA